MCIFRGQKNRVPNHLTVSVATLAAVVLIVVCLNRAQTSSNGLAQTELLLAAWSGVLFLGWDPKSQRNSKSEH